MSDNISELISALKSDDIDRRREAAEELSYLAEDAQASAVELCVACDTDDEELREWAVAALEEMGAPATSQVASLAKLLSHPCSDVGYWAATLIGRCGSDGVDAIPPLINALNATSDSAIRQRAAWALGEIGPSAAAAVDALRQAAVGYDSRLARIANRAIEQILQAG